MVCLIAACIHFAIIFAIFFWFGLPVKLYRIPTHSMEPTLQVGDYFLIDRTMDKLNKLQRGDVVVFASPTNPHIDYVKRVVGLPGEVVEITNTKVWINGQLLNESDYAKAQDTQKALLGRSHYGPLAVPEHSVYVLGDNRNQSLDSRQFKSIDRSNLKGKALYILWSVDKKRIGRALF